MIIYMHTYIPSFRDYFPVSVIAKYFEFSVLGSRSLLVICFIDNSVYIGLPWWLSW